MKKLLLLILFSVAVLSGCQNISDKINESKEESETVMSDNENYDKGIYALNIGNYDDAISYLNQINNETSKNIVKNIKLHKMALQYYENDEYKKAQDKAMLIKEIYPKYDEVNKLLEELSVLIENENVIKAEQIFEQAKEAFTNQYYKNAYNYLKEVIKLQPEHIEALQLVDMYKVKYDEEIEATERELEKEKVEAEKEQGKAEAEASNNNSSTVSADTKKSEFEKMVLKALTGLASKAYFNSENDFIIEVDSSEWDGLSENEQKDLLYLLGDYIDTLNKDLGDNKVSGFGAIFSEAGRQLKSF